MVELNTIVALIFKLSITKALMGFPLGSAGKESSCNAGDLSSIRGLGRSPGEGHGYPLQYSGPENSMDSIVCGVISYKMGTIKDGNGMDLTEDIKRRWQEYTEELYKKIFMTQITMMV